MFRKFTQWFDNPPPKNPPESYKCDYQGCLEFGIYRAPKSRYQLERGVNDWLWLCLTHVRDYNNSWNYYTNMSEAEISHERHNDVTWDRPTWSVQENKKGSPFQQKFDDPFGFFNSGPQQKPPLFVKNLEQEALDLLGLVIPFTRQELRTKYRQLAKKYHPDTNKNNPEAEEMIRKLNHAYSQLQKLTS